MFLFWCVCCVVTSRLRGYTRRQFAHVEKCFQMQLQHKATVNNWAYRDARLVTSAKNEQEHSSVFLAFSMKYEINWKQDLKPPTVPAVFWLCCGFSETYFTVSSVLPEVNVTSHDNNVSGLCILFF